MKTNFCRDLWREAPSVKKGCRNFDVAALSFEDGKTKLTTQRIKNVYGGFMKNIKRIFWLLLGCISMGIGAVGVVLPILPTFPFLLLALFGFAKSSAKMENWFRSTGLYRKHLEPLMEKKTMTRRAKITVMLSMTLFMGIGFWFMDSVPVGRVILALVWLFHMIYFTKGIRTAAAGEV